MTYSELEMLREYTGEFVLSVEEAMQALIHASEHLKPGQPQGFGPWELEEVRVLLDLATYKLLQSLREFKLSTGEITDYSKTYLLKIEEWTNVCQLEKLVSNNRKAGRWMDYDILNMPAKKAVDMLQKGLR